MVMHLAIAVMMPAKAVLLGRFRLGGRPSLIGGRGLRAFRAIIGAAAGWAVRVRRRRNLGKFSRVGALRLCGGIFRPALRGSLVSGVSRRRAELFVAMSARPMAVAHGAAMAICTTLGTEGLGDPRDRSAKP